MSITSLTVETHSNTAVAYAVSDLAAPVFFYWYNYGAFVGITTAGQKAFALERGEQARIDVIDSNSATLDPIAIAPVGYPPRRTIEFVKSADAEAVEYIVQIHQE